MEWNTDEHPRRRPPAAGPACRRVVTSLVAVAACSLALAAIVASRRRRPASQPPAAGEVRRIAIVLARELRDLPPPLSLLDVPPPDEGVAGARLAINDNNTTGRFLKQEFALDVVESAQRRGVGRGGQEAGRSGRCLRRGRREPADAARARRCAQGPRCADPQCRLQRRPAARARLPAECRAHGAVARHARRWIGAVSGVEALAALVPGARDRARRRRPSPRRCAAPPSGSARRSSRSARSSTRSAAGAPTAGTSRSRSRSRP